MNFGPLKPALLILGAVAVLWYFLRGNSSGQTVIQQQPGTAASGVPNYDSKPFTFNIGSPVATPSPLPPAPLPANTTRLKYNMPFLGASPVSFPKTDDGCGCGGGCSSCIDTCSNNNAYYTDGRGGCMSTSVQQLVRNATKGVGGPSGFSDTWMQQITGGPLFS